MTKTIKEIGLFFENIDYVIIPNHYFTLFSIEDIETSIHRVAANAIMRYNTANTASFILRKEANDDFDRFETDIDLIHYKGGTLFHRILNYNDITQIRLIYDDGSIEEFSVAWEDENGREDRNELQKSAITKDNDLFVSIHRNPKA